MKVCILNYDMISVNSDFEGRFNEEAIESIVGMSDWFEATEEECDLLRKNGYMVVKYIDYPPILSQITGIPYKYYKFSLNTTDINGNISLIRDYYFKSRNHIKQVKKQLKINSVVEILYNHIPLGVIIEDLDNAT